MMKKLLFVLMIIGCSETQSPYIQGPQGEPGLSGFNTLINLGTINPGSTCSYGGILISQGVDTNRNQILDSTEILQSAVVCNGLATSSGNSPNFTPTVAITPCGPNSAQYKEALLGLFGGGVYAFFVGNLNNPADSANILLPDGSYYDTDTSECNFNLSTDSYGNRTMTWNGSSSNGSGPYNAGQAYYNATTFTWTTTY